MRENQSTKVRGCPRVERLTEVNGERTPDTSLHELPLELHSQLKTDQESPRAWAKVPVLFTQHHTAF